MQMFRSIDPALAAQSFSYNPATGVLTWLKRPFSHFTSLHAMRIQHARYAGKEAGHRHVCTVGKTYIQVRMGKIIHYAHRIAWVLVNGPIPEGMQIDHIDGDGCNNRLSNLRLVSANLNKRNQRLLSTNTSGVTGVHLVKKSGRYQARATLNDVSVHIGMFGTVEEAAAARAAFNSRHGFHQNHGQDRPL